METNNKHTPTPWTYEGGDNNSVEINIGRTTASVTRSDKNTGEHVISRDEMQANAEFIVTACNSYEALKQQNEEYRAMLEKLREKMQFEDFFTDEYLDIDNLLTKYQK